jgi:hypothetical protein
MLGMPDRSTTASFRQTSVSIARLSLCQSPCSLPLSRTQIDLARLVLVSRGSQRQKRVAAAKTRRALLSLRLWTQRRPQLRRDVPRVAALDRRARAHPAELPPVSRDNWPATDILATLRRRVSGNTWSDGGRWRFGARASGRPSRGSHARPEMYSLPQSQPDSASRNVSLVGGVSLSE